MSDQTLNGKISAGTTSRRYDAVKALKRRFTRNDFIASSLFFLAVFGSIVAFWSYLTLLGRVGADKAAYAMIVFPIWSLVISWMCEGFVWSPLKVVGVGVILLGNVFVVGRRR